MGLGRASRGLYGSTRIRIHEGPMKKAMGETGRRRAIQEAYNEANGITPQCGGSGAEKHKELWAKEFLFA